MGVEQVNEHMTTTGAALETIKALLDRGQPVGPRGFGTRELLNYGFVVLQPSSEPIHTLDEESNTRGAKYLATEFKLYESGERRASEFAKHARLWAAVKNPDGTVNSNYGYLLFHRKSAGKSPYSKHGPITQWQWAELSLKRDRDTRQAVMKVSLPTHQWFGNKDQVCCQHLAFHIRGQQLHLTCVMRSNDATRGLIYDLPWFCSLLPRMRQALLTHYPELQVGAYTHLAHSMHLYDSEAAKAERMVGRGS